MRYDFYELQAIHARARRERAETVHRILIAPLAALLARPFRALSTGHAGRGRLAGQG